MLDIKSVKLSTQRALIGSITENMRAITLGFTGDSILLRTYFFENPSEEEIELLSVITTEIVADFNEVTSVKEEFFVNNDLKASIKCLDFWAFMRFEGFD